MKTVSLEVAKSLKRYKYPQGQSRFFWRKLNHCSVYEKVDSEENNFRFCAFDAPTFREVYDVCENLQIPVDISIMTTCDELAVQMINFCKQNKAKLCSP